MDNIHAIILGIVEGITEFLPISSTGHLVLAGKLLGIPDGSLAKTFDIVIQLGAILAVVVLYFRELFKWEMIKKLVVAFLPTAVIGLMFYKIVKTYLLSNVWVVLGALLIGGVALIIFERWYAEKVSVVSPKESMSYRDAFLVGCAQAIAVVPGVSRSAATIVGGLSLGLSRKTIVQFSFLLAVPTMAAATGLDLLKNYELFSLTDMKTIAIGFLVSFVVALVVIKWFIRYVQKHNFEIFGWYRIALSIIFFTWIVL